MRIAALMPCLLLAGCFADGQGPAPDQAAAQAPAMPATAMAGAPTMRRAAVGGSAAGGGASTAAARGEPVEPATDPVIEARATCWMKVEHEKGVRDIDKRIAYVDKCVKDAMKAM